MCIFDLGVFMFMFVYICVYVCVGCTHELVFRFSVSALSGPGMTSKLLQLKLSFELPGREPFLCADPSRHLQGFDQTDCNTLSFYGLPYQL